MSDELLGRVLGSKYDDDGFLCVQIETFGTGKATVGWFHLSSTDGFQSRPLDPDDSGACMAYYWFEGSLGYCRLANDPRTQNLLPQSEKGEKFLFGPSGGFVRFKADGSISLFTTDDNTPNGRSVFLQLSSKGLLFSFPYGRLTFDDTGLHVEHNSGAHFDMGAIGGLPPPLDVVSSYISMGAAAVNIDTPAVAIGPADSVAEPLAKAPSTVAALSSITGALTAISAALAALAPVTTNPAAAAGPVGEAVTAITVATTAVATASIELTSNGIAGA